MTKLFLSLAIILVGLGHINSQELIFEERLGNDLPYFKSDFNLKTNNGNFITSGKIYHYDGLNFFTQQDSASNVIVLFDSKGKTIDYFTLNKLTIDEIYDAEHENTIHFISENNDGSFYFINELVLYNISSDLKTITTILDCKNPDLTYSSVKSVVRNNQVILYGSAFTQSFDFGNYKYVLDLSTESIIESKLDERNSNLIAASFNDDGSTVQLFDKKLLKLDSDDNISWESTIEDNLSLTGITVNDKGHIFIVGSKEEDNANIFGIVSKFNSDGTFVNEVIIDKNDFYTENMINVDPRIFLDNIKIVEDQNVLITGMESSEWSHAYKIALKLDSDLVEEWDYRIGNTSTIQFNYDHIALTESGNYLVTSSQSTFDAPPRSFISVISKENILNNITDISDKDYSIYPNPASNYLEINNTAGSTSGIDYKITDITGRLVQKGKVGNIIDIYLLEKGYYLLLLKDDTSNTSIPFIKH